MRHEYARWTFVEITRLRKLLSEGKTPEQIACQLGMRVQRVKERIRQENKTPEQKKAKYERKIASEGYKNRKTPAQPYSHPVVASVRPTQEMIHEAQRRADAPRSLTASFFNDPPKGYSALDRRQGT